MKELTTDDLNKRMDRTSSRPRVAICVIVALLTLGSVGCAPDITETDFYSRHPDPASLQPHELTTLGTAVSGEFELSLKSRNDPHVGYNELFLAATHSGTRVERAYVTLTAQRDSRTAPVVQAAQTVSNEDGDMSIAALFLQPKGPTQQWTVSVDLEVDGQPVGAQFDVPVVDSLWMQQVSAPGDDDVYYISWIRPVRPETGEAPFELAIHREVEGGFAAVDNATIDLYPYMDMGAGEGHSTPYKAPVSTTDGLYQGRVNFIMAGGWDMTVNVRIGDAPEQAVVFRGFTVY